MLRKIVLVMVLDVLVAWAITMFLVWVIPIRGFALSVIVCPISALVLLAGLFGGLVFVSKGNSKVR